MKPTLAIHGGAGTILRSEMTPELEKEYRHGLEAALGAGWKILADGGPSIEAVEAAVVSLEDFPLFNAGRGSVFTHAGRNEMDACVMDGARLMSGAVAFVSNVRNPITLARLVMDKTEHCLLAGEGAVEFARELGVRFEPDEYFFTEHRYRQLHSAIDAGRVQLDHTAEGGDSRDSSRPSADSNDSSRASRDSKNSMDSNDSTRDSRESKIQNRNSKIGTVGAVACDANGDLAAATSTGGMTNKKFGRVGDSCIIGAGTYAENATCAVSCTGHGEFFMLGVTAFDLAARMKYKGVGLATAARETIDRLSEIGGEGGFIAVDAAGNVVMPFNCEGMYRGKIGTEGMSVEIYS